MPAPKILIAAMSNGLMTSEKLGTLIKSNLSCHASKPLTQELIDTLCTQIVESIEYFFDNQEEIL